MRSLCPVMLSRQEGHKNRLVIVLLFVMENKNPKSEKSPELVVQKIVNTLSGLSVREATDLLEKVRRKIMQETIVREPETL